MTHLTSPTIGCRMSYLSRLCAALIIPFALAACAAKPIPKDYSAFYGSNPRSVLIVPVINHSAETEAADLFLTTLAVPLAERGYYVFPTNMTKKLIENDGLSDPQLVHTAATPTLARLFNADAILYVEILDWKAQYVVTSSNIVVEFLYTLKGGKDGSLLWQDQQKFTYSASANTGNIFADIIAAAIVSAIDNARADYTPVAIQANVAALLIDGHGLPYGPYSKVKDKNGTLFPASGTGQISNASTQAVAFPADLSAINNGQPR